MLSRLALLAVLGPLATLCLAGGGTSDDTPSVAAPQFDYQTATLKNGLRIITLEDFSCPIVAIQVWYHVGSKDEDPNRQGFAHMFEHMMFRGTDTLGPTDHFELIRRVGGNTNAYTSFDQTVYVATVPANQLELALWLEAQRMTFLKIDQESFDTERQVVEEERRLGRSRPYGTLFEQALAELFHEHPYRWTPIGRADHLRAAHVQELRDFWTRYYGPNNATLVIAGAVKHHVARHLVRTYFDWIPPGPDPPRVTIREPLPSESRTVELKEPNAPAPLVGVVYHTVPLNHDDYIPLQLLARILGGGESSRLHRELVAEHELAVGAMSSAFSLEHHGVFAIGAAMSPLGAQPKKVMQTIGRHIKRLREEPVSEIELRKARNQLLRTIVTENLTVASKAGALGRAAVLAGDVARVNEQWQAVQKVSAEDLQRVAQTYFASGKATLFNVERNLLGALFGKSEDEEAPITAEPELEPPPPGRPGAARPPEFPTSAPTAEPEPATLEFEQHTDELPNGLKVIVLPNHEVPFVTLKLGLLAGAWAEQKPGVASLALQMLTKGTKKHSEAELAAELELHAISLSGSATLDFSVVEASCVSNHMERAAQLLAEVVQTPTFPPEEFRKLRNQVLTGLEVAVNDPSYIAERELRHRLFGTHPYARTATGEIEDVRAVEALDLTHWWQAHARPDRAVLILAGDIQPDGLDTARKIFADWKTEGAAPRINLPPVPLPADTHIYLVDQPAMQCQIRVGQVAMRRDDPEYHVARLVSQYFGGAFNSRVNARIRVDEGLTYGARGGFETSRFAGRFAAGTFSKLESTAQAVQLLLGEIDRLRDEPPTERELEDTRSYLLGSFPASRETPQETADQLWALEVYGLPPDHHEQMLTRIANTTAEDCTRLVQQSVDPRHLVIIVVGPAAQLQSELEELAPVTVFGARQPAIEAVSP